MKTYSYLICGNANFQTIEEIKTVLCENKVDGVSFFFSEEPYSVTVTVDTKISSVTSKDIEEILIPIFEEKGAGLILPANTKHFSYKGKTTAREPKRVSVKTLVVSVIITLVISVLFTYIFASGLFTTPVFGPSQNAEVIDISDATKQVEILNKVFAQLEIDYNDLDTDKLTDALLKAYVEASGDKYAIYYNAEEYTTWLEEQKGTSAGIGVVVSKANISVNSESITVVEILYVNSKSPAMAAGLKAGDCIYAVEKGEEKIHVNSVGYDKATDLLLGEVDTYANISVYRKDNNGEYTSIDFSIKREVYESDTVLGSVCETNPDIGVVKLLSFGLKTPKQFFETVDTLKNQGCKYFIFDLRSNPGGDLNAIKAIMSYFLNEGDLILSVEYSDGTKKEHFAEVLEYDENSSYFDCSVSKEDIGKYKDLKFNILTDTNTASAAELFTATVRDYGLGKIIGEARTYGKGCMQSIVSLNSYGLKGGLRVTTAMYFSKSHTVYHDIGIVPDIIEPLNDNAKQYSAYNLPHGADNQLQVAINELFK